MKFQRTRVHYFYLSLIIRQVITSLNMIKASTGNILMFEYYSGVCL